MGHDEFHFCDGGADEAGEDGEADDRAIDYAIDYARSAWRKKEMIKTWSTFRTMSGNFFAVTAFPIVASAAPAVRRSISVPPFSVGGNFPARKPAVLGKSTLPSATSFRLRAVADDYESGIGKKNPRESSGAVSVVDAVEEEKPDAAPFTVELKRKLIEQLYGTDLGLKATSETRAEVNELITQLEARNPNPAPTEALNLLNGKWILAYTSFAALFPLLVAGRLPQFVKVDKISQTIDSEAFMVQNSVLFVGPFSTTSFSTNAKFEVRSPKRVQMKFEEGIIGTPQLTDSIVIPDKVELFGQSVDLSPFNCVISSLQATASSVAKAISGQPPLKIPISTGIAESWLLTTYLDHELRISRGDGNSVFVLVKEGSSLSSPDTP